jgi:hypothetical protein
MPIGENGTIGLFFPCCNECYNGRARLPRGSTSSVASDTSIIANEAILSTSAPTALPCMLGPTNDGQSRPGLCWIASQYEASRGACILLSLSSW